MAVKCDCVVGLLILQGLLPPLCRLAAYESVVHNAGRMVEGGKKEGCHSGPMVGTKEGEENERG